MAIEIFMGDIIAIELTDRLHHLTDGRILSKIACIGVNEPMSEIERLRNARPQTTRRDPRSMQVEQLAHRLDWRPTWLTIIADLNNSNRPPPVPHSVEERLTRPPRNTGPYA